MLGTRFDVAPMMRGSKVAVKLHGTIYFSPAMYDLIEHASQDELQTLLGSIPLLDLDKFERTMEGNG